MRCPGLHSGGYYRFPLHHSDLKKRLDRHFSRSDRSTQVFIRLIFAMLMVVIVIFLGGAIHSAVSGLGLSAIDPLAPTGRYIYSSAITKGITQGIVIPLIILVPATLRFTQLIIGLRQPSNRDRQCGFVPFSLNGRIRRRSSPTG